MKSLIFSLLFVLAATTVIAVPAKPGVWKTLRLADGTEIEARLVGDEFLHFWQTADGQNFIVADDNGTAKPADLALMRQRALSRRSSAGSHFSLSHSTQRRSPRNINLGEKTHYVGQKKGIVILMQFADTKFKTENDPATFNDILNKEDYVTKPFRGSVADYFRAQSNGLFEIQFDVVGPYTAKYKVEHYGTNNSIGDDLAPDELIVEAVTAADDEVNFQDYDWDGDGLVDQVYVIFAGKGEADGGGAKTIWPHMWLLSKTNAELTLDSVMIDTYACSNELKSNGTIEGIGNICHEFSHCLGFPDFYDTSYQGWFGMSYFDLLNSGCYNGNSFLPAGYSAYEKWMAGWIEPTVLADKDVNVKGIRPMSEDGEAFIIYNSGWPDEYYMVENRQLTGWDAALPGKGLMITHVDFDKEIWEENAPNTRVTQNDVENEELDYTKVNDHQRLTIFHADNDDDSDYWKSYGYYTKTTLSTDLYPCEGNNSLTSNSAPAATLYNKNRKGKNYMEGGITDIEQNDNGTMNFRYFANIEYIDPEDPTKPVEPRGDTLFYESFNKCDGIGANDGKWNTNIAQSVTKFITDNARWSYEAAYAGYQCARFGNNTKNGETTTPLFTINGNATLTFRAAGWNTDGTALAIALTNSSDKEATIEPCEMDMKSFEWTDYTAKIKGRGTVKITFKPEKRFLLDEVLVLNNDSSTAITTAKVVKTNTIYTLDGRCAGEILHNLPHGIYIVDGRKIVR
jgi:M6 family metalloprotease-like protein